MKYECAIDCNLLCLNENNTFTTDENASRCTNQDYSMTSFMSDELSGLSSMTYVDRAVHDIMSNNSPNNSESNKNNIMKFMINCLHGQIKTMKQEIAFLRKDSKCKNSTVLSEGSLTFLRLSRRSSSIHILDTRDG